MSPWWPQRRWTNHDLCPVRWQPNFKSKIIPCGSWLHGRGEALENPSPHLKMLSKSQCKLTFPGNGFFLVLAKPHCKCLAATVWLHRTGKKNVSACWTGLSAVPACRPKCLAHHETSNVTSVDYLKSCIVHEWEKKSVCQIIAFGSQRVLLKEELMQQHGKHDPVQTETIV